MSEYLDLDDIDFTLYDDGELGIGIYAYDASSYKVLKKEDVARLVEFLGNMGTTNV